MQKMKVENVIFDLDGTIIDSYPGILNAFNSAYKKLYGIDNNVDLKPHIGPPLREILTSVNGETDKEKLERFALLFKEQYDNEDFKLSVLYEGMNVLLKHLHQAGIKIFLATNKREKPTRLIAKYLFENDYFCGIYCSDLENKNYASKVEMVRDLIENENLKPETTVLIGDASHDEEAAKQNNIAFIYAAYGFGNLEGIEKTILNPSETLNFINT